MKYEFKGTPGPYKISVEHDTYKDRAIVRCSLSTDNGSAPDGLEYSLANGHGNLSEFFASNDDTIANFHLFCASPLLLSALINTVKFCENLVQINTKNGIEPPYPTLYHEAKAAIESALSLSPDNTQP